MCTLVVRMTLDPARLDDVDRHLEQDVAPWARRQAGFRTGRWLRSADGKQGMGVMVFESEQAARAAAEGPRHHAPVDGRAWNIDEVELFDQVVAVPE